MTRLGSTAASETSFFWAVREVLQQGGLLELRHKRLERAVVVRERLHGLPEAIREPAVDAAAVDTAAQAGHGVVLDQLAGLVPVALDAPPVDGSREEGLAVGDVRQNGGEWTVRGCLLHGALNVASF